ncbi:MAG TPA: hypothetical protein DD429_09015, partial [Clostridiaceae bacterium]|nr:hypothetical protein [Clostridiaceae bacterium]
KNGLGKNGPGKNGLWKNGPGKNGLGKNGLGKNGGCLYIFSYSSLLFSLDSTELPASSTSALG